ncbi:DNA-binding protein [Lactococcus lactis]|nr:DNA-binding protein [Lactococcus lactis]RQE00833.1 DNA-binding protein [Lactococcus lactis]RQE11431.1 DNA-binding protein [Lactococcus lactis]
MVKRGVEIDKLHELLDQQQRLALQDKKLLEEYKAENDRLKVLKMPSQDTKENQSQEEVQTIKKQMEALNDKIKGQEQLNNQVSKKWYQFWK